MASSDAIISFSFAGLPASYCFTTPERFALDIAAALQGYLPGAYSTIIRSSTEPAATDRDKVWVQVNADGAMTGRIFTWAYGTWVMQNPRRDPSERVWFEGSEADAWSYDGGDGTDPSSNPPTTTTGAMWEYDTNYAFRFPLMAGTSDTPTTVSIGDTGGEEKHTLVQTELPDVSFPITQTNDPTLSGTDVWGSGDLGDGSFGGNGLASTGTSEEPTRMTIESGGSNTPFSVLPPYRVGAWLKPTARQFYTP